MTNDVTHKRFERKRKGRKESSPMKICFKTEPQFERGIERLAHVLNYQIAEEGISLRSQQCDRVGVSLANGEGVIYYKEKHHFFRELGVFIQKAKEQDAFDLTEDGYFETIGVMFNASSCAIPTVDSVKLMTDYLAVMGYNLMMLYTEDTVELENRPYFGHMQGRYTKAELKVIDDYAYDYGIEVIPCLECYGHMASYLKWAEAKPIKDTASVLLAREEATFVFLDELIGEVSSCFRSKRIHIGMDEAWDMGRGAFLDRNGYVPPVQIFNEYMERLIGITNKYDLIPMMWSDMYFRINSRTGSDYYGEYIQISPETKAMIPKEVQLVFWHYGEEPHCDDYMLKKHLELDRDVIFAGGLWDWSGLFPEHNYAYEATKFSLEACRNNGVKEMMVTSWNSVNLFTNLFGLSFTAELCYKQDSSEEELRKRFEAVSGGDYDAFFRMSNFHNKFGETEEYPDFNQRFLGKHLFWQDILGGFYEHCLEDCPMSGHYEAQAEQMKQYSGKWEEFYRLAETVFAYLSVKTRIAETLYPAYKAKDRETLEQITEVLLPRLGELTREVHRRQQAVWCTYYRQNGWWFYDYALGGMMMRCETAKELLKQFLAGEIPAVDELEEARLGKKVNAFTPEMTIAMPLLK